MSTAMRSKMSLMSFERQSLIAMMRPGVLYRVAKNRVFKKAQPIEFYWVFPVWVFLIKPGFWGFFCNKSPA